MMTHRVKSPLRWSARIALLPLAATLACGQPGADADLPADAPDLERAQEQRARMSRDFTAQLDSGNAAYSAEKFEEALRHYRAATEVDDGIAAAWFGVYMAEDALGNADSAAVAFQRAQAAAPGTPMIHPTRPDTTP